MTATLGEDDGVVAVGMSGDCEGPLPGWEGAFGVRGDGLLFSVAS
jgi:hypothetical protein